MADTERAVSQGVDGRTATQLETVRPDLYRQSAFRLAELPVEAGSRELQQRQRLIDLAERTGLELAAGPSRVLPLEHGPDAETVRAAIQRLRDPERRLLDELFWFWPTAPGGRGDEALTQFGSGDLDGTLDRWLDHQDSVGRHNLAVLTHAAALDLEALAASRPLDDQERTQRDLFWSWALTAWRELVDDEALWDRLRLRVRDLHDPRLTAGLLRRWRQALPTALLGINAQLAVRAAEAGQVDEARRQVDLISAVVAAPPLVAAPPSGDRPVRSAVEIALSANQEAAWPAAAEEALRRAVEPVRARLKILCDTADTEANGNALGADAIAERLIDQAVPLLQVLDAVLPVGNPLRDGAHDEVALSLLGVTIAFGNASEEWRAAKWLIDAALALAATELAIGRLRENLQTIEGNLLAGVCWFCRARPNNGAADIDVKMYGNVTREQIFDQIQTRWQHGSVTVPRCQPCRAIHRHFNWAGVLVWVCGLILSVQAYNALSGTILNSGVGPFACFLLGLIVTGFAARSTHPEHIELATKPLSETNNYPVIQDRLRQGWAFGERPAS